jgi:beta-lactamase superfamily II metal-dependent hydrolase
MRNTFLFLFALFALDLALGLSLLRWGGPSLKVHVLDVGQGDAVLVTTPEQHSILIDGGPGQKVLEELGEVLPITQHELDLLILTHPHLDHMEGLVAVLQRFKVDNILLSAPTYDSLVYTAFLEALENENARIWIADDDRDFRLGSLNIDVLYPFEPTLGKDFENVNNASPVFKAQPRPF